MLKMHNYTCLWTKTSAACKSSCMDY